MAGVFGDHFGLIINDSGSEEVVVGTGLGTTDITELAARLARVERVVGHRCVSVEAMERQLLEELRTTVLDRIVAIRARLDRREREHRVRRVERDHERRARRARRARDHVSPASESGAPAVVVTA